MGALAQSPTLGTDIAGFSEGLTRAGRTRVEMDECLGVSMERAAVRASRY